jgi:hypothetical protein
VSGVPDGAPPRALSFSKLLDLFAITVLVGVSAVSSYSCWALEPHAMFGWFKGKIIRPDLARGVSTICVHSINISRLLTHIPLWDLDHIDARGDAPIRSLLGRSGHAGDWAWRIARARITSSRHRPCARRVETFAHGGSRNLPRALVRPAEFRNDPFRCWGLSRSPIIGP